jgi:hypothetical protein
MNGFTELSSLLGTEANTANTLKMMKKEYGMEEKRLELEFGMLYLPAYILGKTINHCDLHLFLL